jgi:hypothetical protein
MTPFEVPRTNKDLGNHDFDTFDVLEDHRRRNHGTHPPDPARFDSRQHQRARPANNLDDSNSDTEQPERRRAPRNSGPSKPVKPTNLAYYPGQWQDVQTSAKKKMRRYIALFHAFPDRENDLDKAEGFLTETLAEYEAAGKMVEEGAASFPLS